MISATTRNNARLEKTHQIPLAMVLSVLEEGPQVSCWCVACSCQKSTNYTPNERGDSANSRTAPISFLAPFFVKLHSVEVDTVCDPILLCGDGDVCTKHVSLQHQPRFQIHNSFGCCRLSAFK